MRKRESYAVAFAALVVWFVGACVLGIVRGVVRGGRNKHRRFH